MSSPGKKKTGSSTGTGKTKKAPPVMAISRAPAGVHEARIKAELSLKEDRCREYFENNSHLFKKSRNPCNGELTSREDSDFLIPIEHTIKKLTQKAAYQEYEQTKAQAYQDTSSHTYHNRVVKPTEINRLDMLKNHRLLIEEELKQLELVRGLNGSTIFPRPY